jgi:hypothetical protein
MQVPPARPTRALRREHVAQPISQPASDRQIGLHDAYVRRRQPLRGEPAAEVGGTFKQVAVLVRLVDVRAEGALVERIQEVRQRREAEHDTSLMRHR